MNRIQYAGNEFEGWVTSHEYSVRQNQDAISVVNITIGQNTNLYTRPMSGDSISVHQDYSNGVIREVINGYIQSVNMTSAGNMSDSFYSGPRNINTTIEISIRRDDAVQDGVNPNDDPFGTMDEDYATPEIELTPTPEPIPEPEPEPEPPPEAPPGLRGRDVSLWHKAQAKLKEEENKFEPISNNRLKHIDEFDTIHREKIEENFDEREDNTI